MTGQIIGYKRVSTLDQNTERQLEGVTLDAEYEEKVSAKDMNRPELIAMLKHARKGDTVIVHSMDRLARNLIDLKTIVSELVGKGVAVKFLKENLTFTGKDDPYSELMLNMMGSFAEFERQLIKSRQMEGIALAKARGAFKGSKRKVTDEQIALIKSRVAAGDSKAAIARDLKISRETLYQYLA